MSREPAARPLLVRGICAAVALALVALAIGTPGSVSPAPLPETGPAQVQVVAEAPPEVSPRVAAVAVGAIVSGLRSDPDVAAARPEPPSGTSTTIDVQLKTSDARTAEQEIGRLREQIDPGPLQLSFRSDALTLTEARHSIQGDLGRLELLIAPLALLVLLGMAGLRAGAAAPAAAVIAVAGALTAIRLTGGELFAIAPAAAIGIAQAVELTGLYAALHREESVFGPPSTAASRALAAWWQAAAAATALRALAPLALLATGFDAAGSIAVACAAAAVLPFGVLVVAGPSIGAGRAPSGAASPGESRAGRALRATPRTLSRRLAVPLVVIGVAVTSAHVIASPAHDAAATPLVGPGESGVLHELGVAAVLLTMGLGAALALGRRPLARLRLALLAPFSLLATGAALGVLVFVTQQGHLASTLTGSREALVGGSVATVLVAVSAISAGRSVLAATLARVEAAQGIGAVGAAELTAGLTVPATAASTLIVAACFGALAGADLGAAREVGVGVAAGVIVDLALLRLPFLAALARWGGD